MSHYQIEGSDAFWGTIIFFALVVCCFNGAWGGVAFWGIADVTLTLSIIGKRIEHALRERV